MKKIARIFASSLLRTTLLTAAITAAIVGVLGTPNTIRTALNDSKFYDHLVDNALTEASKNTNSGENNPFGQPEVRQAAQTALTPAVLKSSTDQILTGVYNWLDGKTALPDYRVDLTGVKQNFIQAAGDAAASHVGALPTCTTQQLRALNGIDDPFALTCRPAALTTAAAKQQVITQLSNNDEFLKDPVLTATTFNKDGQENPFQKADAAPKAFQKAKTAPVVLLLLSVLLAIAVFFLSDTKRQGTRKLALVGLSTGIVLLVISWLLGVVFDKMAQPSGSIGQKATNSPQTSVLEAIRIIDRAFNKTVLIYGLIYTLLGGLTLLALKFLWKTNTPAKTPQSGSKPGALV